MFIFSSNTLYDPLNRSMLCNSIFLISQQTNKNRHTASCETGIKAGNT